MARVKVKHTRKNAPLVALVHGRLEADGMNVAELAALIGMDDSTLYRRLRNPDSFRLDELRKLLHYYRVTPEFLKEVI